MLESVVIAAELKNSPGNCRARWKFFNSMTEAGGDRNQALTQLNEVEQDCPAPMQACVDRSPVFININRFAEAMPEQSRSEILAHQPTFRRRRALSAGSVVCLAGALLTHAAASSASCVPIKVCSTAVQASNSPAMPQSEAAHPDAAGDAYTKAMALVEQGQLSQAESSLQAAEDTGAASVDSLRLLGYVLYREGKTKESLAAYTRSAQLRTPRPEDLKVVAFDYVLLGDYTDAAKWLARITEWTPADADAWYYLGRARYSLNQFADAVQAFTSSLRYDPRSVRAEDNLGLSYEGLGDSHMAEEAYRTAIAWQSDSAQPSAQPYLNLGALLAQHGAVKQAVPELEQAARLAPSNPKVHEQLGDGYKAEDRWKDAEKEFTRAVQLAPEVPGLHFQLATIYRHEGMQELAKDEFTRCAKLIGTTSARETPNPASP